MTFRETMVFAAGGFEPMPCGEDDVLRWDEYPETAECENLYDIIGDAIDAAEGRDDDEPSGRYADLP
ncbi:MAG: hypothetical protein ACKVVT_11525 [Dehalococcoidia bacterium]